jgi:hypothetical protein
MYKLHSIILPTKITELNQARAETADHDLNSHQVGLGNTFENSNLHAPPASWLPIHQPIDPYNSSPVRETTPINGTIKLKGVDLPNFSGENKADYETRKASFMSIIDEAEIPASENMLRLQSSLSGKVLMMVKDLGYSLNAYEQAKSKLEKKYGGERRLMIKHLTALRDMPR